MIMGVRHHMLTNSNMGGGISFAINRENDGLYVGIAYCRPGDQFNRKIGRKIATNNARIVAENPSKNAVLSSRYGYIMGFKLFKFNEKEEKANGLFDIDELYNVYNLRYISAYELFMHVIGCMKIISKYTQLKTPGWFNTNI